MTTDSSDENDDKVDPPGTPPATAPITIRSEELFQGQMEVLIAHGAATYRLRLTRNGKLILNK